MGNDHGQITQDQPDYPVDRSVTIDVDPDQAWKLLTDPHDVTHWLGHDVSLDPTPGAEGHVRDLDGTRRRLVVDEALPGERLSWHWWIDDDGTTPHPSRVEITLTPVADGTRIHVIELRPPTSTQARASLNVGASSSQTSGWGFRLLHLELLALLVAARA